MAEVTKTISLPTTPPVIQQLSWWERLLNQGAVRKFIVILVLATIWQIYGAQLDNELLFPTLEQTVHSLWEGLISGVLPERIWNSVRVLLTGYTVGIAIASVITAFAVTTRWGTMY